MISLRVTYHSAIELGNDIDRQFARGGLLVRVEIAADTPFETPVALEIVAGDHSLSFEAKVMQVMPGFGVAVSVPVERLEEIRAVSDALASSGAATEAPSTHERLQLDVSAVAPDSVSPPTHGDEVGRMVLAEQNSDSEAESEPSKAQKMHKALHGTRDERTQILRDRNRQLHAFVLKNPQISLEEIVAIAKNPQMSADLLKMIGERKEWFQRTAVATALVRNPRTPPGVAVRLLEFVSSDTLRQLAKGVGALPHIAQAARKKVIPT